MRLKKIACTILSLVCMFFLGLGIYLQKPVTAKAETPTVTVAINQGANNVAWADGTQKRVLLNIVDKATGEVASFTAWENMTSVIGNGVTINGSANLNFFGSTGDGVSVIYPSTLEDGAVFSIAEGTVINGYVFPKFTLALLDGKWVKEPTVTVAINQGANNVAWDDGTQKRVLLNIVDKATGEVASFTAWENMTSVIGNGVTINGSANLNFFGSTGDGVSVIYPSSLEDGAVFNIALGTEANGHVFPAFTLYLVNGKWQANKPVAESVTITNIHNRAGSDQRLLLFLSNSNYTTANANVTDKIASLNVLDYVNVYTSKTEYKTLREIYQGNAQAKIWGEANSVGFQVDANYHGTAVYAVEIKAGAQFPSSANSYDTYVVSADITYYNNDYQSTNAELNGWAVSWTTVKPVEPEIPELGTPDVEFVEIHNDNNNSVWGNTTRAVRLTFDKSFTAKAYDANEGGWDTPTIAHVRNFTKINGQSLGNMTFLQVDNENSITFLYDESLLTVPAGQDYTTFTIEEGAPFGGHYLPAVTLYLVNGKWCENKPVEESVTITGIHNRKGGDQQRLLLFLSNSDYGTNNANITAKIANLNVLDYVNVYTSETEYKTLREIYQDSALAKIWGEANSVGFAVDENYHGTAVYAIEIKKGAKFPAATNDYTTYVVSADIAFYNMDYKSTDSEKNGFATTWTRMHAVTLKGELATGEDSVKLYVVPGQVFAYPEKYSKTQAGDENTVYIYNWYLNGELYDFSTPVTGDITLTADGTFTEYTSYNVTFNDGETQNTVIVGEGQTVAAPDAPTKTETSEYKYVFNGWYNGDAKWDFSAPITENVALTAKYDQVKKLVLSDLYMDGKASAAIKTGEIKIANSGDHYKGYVGSNVYFDLALELSYKTLITGDGALATFDVKITNDSYNEANTSPFYLAWHVYYQRPANTLYIEYHKYNKDTGARETVASAVSTVAIDINEIYQANFAYRVIDEATGSVEMYSNIAGWENIWTYELGVEYFATAANYEYIAFVAEATATEMNLTFADPGLTGAAHYDVIFKNGDTTIMSGMSNQIQLPSIEGEVVEDGLSKVFVGWTTDLNTLPDLYPAGYKLKLTDTTELYAVWMGFEMQNGASVRLTAGSSGIRFTSDLYSADYKKLGSYVLGTGTLIVPTEYLTKAKFVHSSFGTGYYKDIATTLWREQGDDASVWSYSSALVNIGENQYARSLSARGYVKVNFTSGEGYVYTMYDEEKNARSIYEVATSAYNDTEKNYKENAQILEYVNSVADITLSNEMGLDKNETSVGDYTLTSNLVEKTFTVSVSHDISSAMINGTRITSGATKNVQIGDFIFSIKDVAINGSELTFTVAAALELNDKYSDDNTYFRSSDAELDFFLNDYFNRHATGLYENGEDQTVNSVVAGDDAEEFFWWEWFSTAYYMMDTDSGFDRIEGLREKLANVPVDDYGYVWQNTDVVRDAKSTLASAEHRMGWPFPTANEMVVVEGVRTSLFGASTNYITKGYSTSWDFNGNDRTAWSSNVNAALSEGLFKGTANGASSVEFSSPTLPQTHTVKKYSGLSSSNITVYDEPAIYTYYAPLLELDVRMSNADNVKDIVVYFKTNEGGSTEYSMSVNDYAFIKYDYSGKYEHMLFLPMYAHEDWGDSETRYVTNLRIEIIPEDGKTLSGDFALSYVRPSLDTRHTNNNSIFISSLRQDYDYTGDLDFLEQNITRARKAINFLMQFYDADRSLLNSSYLVGHDADKTGSDMAQRIAHSLGNGYWDISFMPEYDFHSNSYFYKAVADMAYLENILTAKGSAYASAQAKAEANVQTAGRISNDTLGKGFAESDYSALNLTATATNTLNAIRATTNNTDKTGFWDATKGRFIAGYGDANADGASEWVDYGYLVWNLEAIYYGIATEDQARLIMQWVTGERTVAGDTSTGEDIYFFEFAPRATTYQGSSATDSSVYTGVWHGTNNGGEYGVSQVQHGGAIMYTSYYDLMNRIAVNGADDAYMRLNAIKDWYMDVYAYYQSSGSTPDDFYWDYYENSQWDSNGDGKGEYWKLQNGIKGQAERDGFTGGVIGIDGEFLESFLPVAAIPYGFFGIESLGNGILQIAPKLPVDLDYWTAENLTFDGCKYDVTIYDNALQITAVRGETTDLKLKVAFDAPASDYRVYVNGFATTEYEVVNGQIIVELAFGNAIVAIR